MEIREKGALRCKVDKEEYLKIYGGLKEGIEMMEACLHGPMDAAKNLKLRFWVGNLDLPEMRKRCTSIRVEEEEDKQNCQYGKAIESRTHIVAECENIPGGTGRARGGNAGLELKWHGIV